MKTQKFNSIFVIIVLIGTLFLTNCKTKVEDNEEDPKNKIIAITTFVCKTIGESLVKIAQFAYTIDEDQDNEGSYDENTKKWIFDSITKSKVKITVVMQLQNDQGIPQKYYDGLETSKILGTVTNSESDEAETISFEFEMTQVQVNYAFIKAKGSGNASFLGETCVFDGDNFKFERASDGIPEGGYLNLYIGDITVRLEFTGDSQVKATYTYEGQPYEFYLNFVN